MAQYPCASCGSVAKTDWIRSECDPLDPNVPHFPFLKNQQVANAASAFGLSQIPVCLLCKTMLLGQWQLHEKNNTPLATRQYWSKAFTSDSERLSQSFGNEPANSPHQQNANTNSNSDKAQDSTLGCTFCSKQFSRSAMQQLSIDILRKIPELGNYMSSLPTNNGTVPVCLTCYQNPLLQTVMNGSPGAAPTTAMELLYQLMLQQAGLQTNSVSQKN